MKLREKRTRTPIADRLKQQQQQATPAPSASSTSTQSNGRPSARKSASSKSSRGSGGGRGGRGGRGRGGSTKSGTASTNRRVAAITAEQYKAGTPTGGRRGGRSTAGRKLKREHSVASSSASKSIKRPKAVAAPKPWEASSDEEEPNEPRGGWTKRRGDSDPDESDMASEAKNTSEEEDASLFYDFEEATTSARGMGEEEDDEEDIFCPWAQLPPEQIPPLELPNCSMDLMIDSSNLLEILEVYEVLLNFSPILQLSPFLFEDFCCALRNESQSKLIGEIHIAFLRLFFREEEQEHTTFAVSESNPSFNIVLQLLDHMNYAEVLRHYLESDPTFSREVHQIMHETNYPFVPFEKRLVVLKWLCERFFETNIFKKMVKNGGKIKHDQHCRDCAKLAGGTEMIACAGCEAVYHLPCANLKEWPLNEENPYWFCAICHKHAVRGATDCMAPGQTALRKLPLGYDRFGRIYWFLVRRIFVFDPTTNYIFYYSTLPQLYNLITALDPHHFERRLCRRLAELLTPIAVQMNTTLELTDERRALLQAKGTYLAEPYLHVVNAHLMAKIVYDVKKEHEHKMETDEEEHKEEEDEDDEEAERDIVKMVQRMLCINHGRLEETYWSGGLNEEQLLANHNLWYGTMETDPVEHNALFDDLDKRKCRGSRLGFADAGYRLYSNWYVDDELAKSPYVRAKERDKRRNLNLRFCIADDGEFSWPHQKGTTPFGPQPDVLKCVQLAFCRLIERIPDGLMHRRWVLDGERRTFMERLVKCEDVPTLRELLLLFERALRKPAFLNVWWSSYGLTNFNRVTSEDRERRQKFENAKRREEKTLATVDSLGEYSDIVWVKYTLHGGQLPKHQIWKTRDGAGGSEQFRINGIGDFGGWLWVAATLVRHIVPAAEKPDKNNPNSLASKKATHLRRIANKLLMWRTVEQFAELYRSGAASCFSPSCRLITASCAAGSPAIGAFCPFKFGGDYNDEGLLLPCYNSGCARNRADPTSTRQSANAKPPQRPSKASKEALASQGVPGEDVPFPFPKPYNFKRKASGKTSILVIPDWCLRRLARQGGLSQKTAVPGFNPMSKANPLAWPYPCSRPLFDHCWRYLTAVKGQSLHAIALRFRQLYSSIRWMDMNPLDPDDPDKRVWNHFADHDEVRTVIGHKENPPDGFYEQYKIRVEQYPLEEDLNGWARDADAGLAPDDRDFRQSAGRGSAQKKRGRKRPKPSWENDRLRARRAGPFRVEERWIDGIELKLYEIADYWQRLHNAQRQQRRQEVLQAARGTPIVAPRPPQYGHPQQIRPATAQQQRRVVLAAPPQHQVQQQQFHLGRQVVVQPGIEQIQHQHFQLGRQVVVQRPQQPNVTLTLRDVVRKDPQFLQQYQQQREQVQQYQHQREQVQQVHFARQQQHVLTDHQYHQPEQPTTSSTPIQHQHFQLGRQVVVQRPQQPNVTLTLRDVVRKDPQFLQQYQQQREQVQQYQHQREQVQQVHFARQQQHVLTDHQYHQPEQPTTSSTPYEYPPGTIVVHRQPQQSAIPQQHIQDVHLPNGQRVTYIVHQQPQQNGTGGGASEDWPVSSSSTTYWQ